MFASHDVITTRNLSARLLDDIIWVAFIATADIRRCAWPLIRAMLFRHEAGDDGANDDERAEAEDDGFFSLTHDEEGITLIMDSACRAAFDEFCDGNTITYAPCTWRAFQIHLGTSATPGCAARARERARVRRAAPMSCPRPRGHTKPCGHAPRARELTPTPPGARAPVCTVLPRVHRHARAAWCACSRRYSPTRTCRS